MNFKEFSFFSILLLASQGYAKTNKDPSDKDKVFAKDLLGAFAKDSNGNCLKSYTWGSDVDPRNCYKTVEVKKPQEKFSLSSEALFGFGLSALSPEGRLTLTEVAKKIPSSPVRKIIHISGHTDWIGNEDFNQKLSAERAEVAKAFLVNQGVPEDQIITEGKGSTESIATNSCRGLKGEELTTCLKPDRRIEIEVHTEL